MSLPQEIHGRIDALLPEAAARLVSFLDLLERTHQTGADMDGETRAWMAADLSRIGEIEPYDWGPDGPPKGKPVRYEPGVGFVIEGGRDA